MPQAFIRRPWPLAVLLVLASACSPLQPIVLAPASPHARYLEGLESTGLDASVMGAQWTRAASKALTSPLPAPIPFATSAYAPADEPIALGYRLSPARGQRVVVTMQVHSSAPLKVFLEVFEQRADEQTPRLMAHAADSSSLAWTAQRDRQYIVRVQPELLRSARIDLRITAEASIGFPVSGRSSEQVRSFFGDARDGGKRRHEGLDIFAPKGTPVVASTDGWASASQNRLGGKVVWLRSGEADATLYYAHLDSQCVGALQRVRAGDTLGLVGNTGNAEHTPAHLHFGIYASDGSVDPLPFVNTRKREPPGLDADTALLFIAARVKHKQTALRAAPDAKAAALAMLMKDTYVRARAATGSWYEVEFEDTLGYVHASALEALKKPLKQLTLASATDLVDAPLDQAPLVQRLEAGTRVQLLAHAGAYQHVRSGEVAGWIVTH